MFGGDAVLAATAAVPPHASMMLATSMGGRWWQFANASSGYPPIGAAPALRDRGKMSKQSRPAAYTAVQKQVGERIRLVREQIIPNQREAAEVLGVDPSTLNKWEAGTRPPSIFNVIEMANRFRVSTDFLLRDLLIAKTDEELALRLAALRPSAVPPPERRDTAKGKGPGDGKLPLPTTQGSGNA